MQAAAQAKASAAGFTKNAILAYSPSELSNILDHDAVLIMDVDVKDIVDEMSLKQISALLDRPSPLAGISSSAKAILQAARDSINAATPPTGPPSAPHVLSDRQFLSLDPNQIAKLTKMQMSHIGPLEINMASPATIAALYKHTHKSSLPAAARAALESATPVNTGLPNPADMDDAAVRALTPTTAAMLTAQHMENIKGPSAPNIDDKIIRYIPPAAFYGLQSNVFNGMSKKCIAAISKEQMASMNTMAFPTLDSKSISYLSADAVSGITGHQITVMPIASLMSINAAHIKSLSKDAITSLGVGHANSLRANTHWTAGITSHPYFAMTDPSFRAIFGVGSSSSGAKSAMDKLIDSAIPEPGIRPGDMGDKLDAKNEKYIEKQKDAIDDERTLGGLIGHYEYNLLEYGKTHANYDRGVLGVIPLIIQYHIAVHSLRALLKSIHLYSIPGKITYGDWAKKFVADESPFFDPLDVSKIPIAKPSERGGGAVRRKSRPKSRSGGAKSRSKSRRGGALRSKSRPKSRKSRPKSRKGGVVARPKSRPKSRSGGVARPKSRKSRPKSRKGGASVISRPKSRRSRPKSRKGGASVVARPKSRRSRPKSRSGGALRSKSRKSRPKSRKGGASRRSTKKSRSSTPRRASSRRASSRRGGSRRASRRASRRRA